MAIDKDRIDDAVLALMTLGIHEEEGGLARAWKGFDWDALDRLHAKGYISDPRSKARSVVLTPEGLSRARESFRSQFGGDQ